MRNIIVSINVSLRETEDSVTESDGVERMDDGSFRVILDHQAEFNIDRLESALLQTSYPALRKALSDHLEQASKKKAWERISGAGSGRVEEHPSLYQVDGEVGRWVFKTYDVKSEDHETRFEGIELFPPRHGRQWYQTCGFKEIALLCGAAQRSYRQTTHVFNRSRHQESGGTPLNTLRDGTQTEGLKVIDFLTRKSQSVLKEHGFDPQGVPVTDCAALKQIKEPAYFDEKALQPALTAVGEAMGKRGFSPVDIEQARDSLGAEKTYEQARHCVYIHIDDVGVKEQKPHRNKKGAVQEPVVDQPVVDQKDRAERKRPMVQNTVAHLKNANKSFTLTGRSVAEILLFVLGFLLNNALLGLNLKVCIDGQRSLQDAILRFFSWHPHLTLLLDWFHVVKKFKEDLSLACRGREIRNRHLKKLLTLLWFGLINQAQAYLAAVPATDLKDDKAIARLTAYLERNRQWIPCYAMRRQLGLPNSSNPVERCNNLVTAKRQKHHGMSWSEKGSYALTSLAAVTLNGATRQWIENRTIPFTWVVKVVKAA